MVIYLSVGNLIEHDIRLRIHVLAIKLFINGYKGFKTNHSSIRVLLLEIL